jgi:superfamily II DNA or RNA helicase
VDGETPDEERKEAMRKLESREVLGLSNVELFGEGVDVPTLQAVILLRPTQSRSLHFQQIGRALRPSVNKPHAVILDHAGNSLRLGLPDDDIEWSLQGREKAKAGTKQEMPVKSCPICFAVVRTAVAQCQCGHRFVAKERKVVVKEGELQEVDVAALRNSRLNEQRSADTVEELIALAIKRGYRNPHGWAYQLNKAREAKKLRR